MSAEPEDFVVKRLQGNTSVMVIGLLRRRESQDTVNKKVTKCFVERRDTV